jgi:FkbM family methyltransferase
MKIVSESLTPSKPKSRNFRQKVYGYLAWKVKQFKMDNRVVGFFVQLLGNQVNIDGIKVNVDNPLISVAQKSTLFWGIYEKEEREFIKKYIKPDDSVLELGGSIGVVSCIINKRLSDGSRHTVVEANPLLVPLLKSNRELNGCKFDVVNSAISYTGQQVFFSTNGHFLMGAVADEHSSSTLTVPACSLADVWKSTIDNAVLVCDIEGMEIEVVANESDFLRKRFSKIIMETHPDSVGIDKTKDMITSLKEIGFEQIESQVSVLVFVRKTVKIC